MRTAAAESPDLIATKARLATLLELEAEVAGRFDKGEYKRLWAPDYSWKGGEEEGCAQALRETRWTLTRIRLKRAGAQRRLAALHG